MRFCWTTLLVRDLDESIAFYRDVVGLSVNRRFAADRGSEIAFLGSGETQVELIHREGPPAVPGDAVTLGFAVDSLEQTLDFIKEKGIAIESGPFQPNEHIRFFYVLDPNGVKVQFSQSF